MDTESDLGDSYHIESPAALLQCPPGIAVSPKALDAIIIRTIRLESLQPAALLDGCVNQ